MINDEYDALIKETKDKLRSYSDATAVITKKYAEARAQYEAAKEKSAQILEKNYSRDRNAAAAQVKLDEKNTGEYLASRGLATSGESAQAKLNSNISLNNALSGLSAEHESKLADMLSEKDEYLSRLGIDYAKEYADAENKLLSQAAEVAESKLKHTSSKSGSASEIPAVSDSVGAAEGDGLFDPEMTPYQLASAIVRRFTGGNTVKYAEDNLEISDYLKKLSERYSLTDDFRDQLVFALDALGYSALDDESNALTRLIYDAETEYTDAYSRASALAKKTIPDYEKRQAFIKKYAYFSKLDYIFTRCKNIDEFYEACSLMGMTEKDREAYIEDVANRVGTSSEVRIGESLK